MDTLGKETWNFYQPTGEWLHLYLCPHCKQLSTDKHICTVCKTEIVRDKEDRSKFEELDLSILSIIEARYQAALWLVEQMKGEKNGKR